nr:MAG TPA: hypothetical protein [Caudoviricetes sp.]
MYSTSIISIPFCRAHNITAISAHVIISCLSSAVVVYYPQNILVDVSETPCPVPQPLGGAFSYPRGIVPISSSTVTPYSFASFLWYFRKIAFLPSSQLETAVIVTFSFFATSACCNPAASLSSFNVKRLSLLINIKNFNLTNA